MRSDRDQRLHGLFFTGLALVGGGCSTYQSAPPDTTPHRTGVASGPISDPAALELAKQYKSADPQAGLAGMEIVGMVHDPGLVDTDPTCSKTPCPAEWLKLADMGGHEVVIMRRNGKLEALTELNFKEVLGPLDTAEKVALRMQVEDYTKATTCERMSAQGLACADGSNAAHVPVRPAEGGGFEVVTYGERDVCRDNTHGTAIALGVVKVGAEGEIEPVDNALSLAAAEEVLPRVDCYYPSRGRMFEGFEEGPLERSELEYHLRAAREESAAVVAFERLARELAAHGAPAALVEAASRSAVDERRHARLFRREALRVARALGVELLPAASEPAPSRVRPLFEVLSENAHEGCANETYAALIATHQASNAPSPRMRAVFASIAADERDHAILAHRVHAWGRAVLREPRRTELDGVLVDACARVITGAATPLSAAMGEPDRVQAGAAFRHVVGALSAA